MQYEIKDNKVIVDKDSFNEESEIQYLNFVLGYDLLNNFYKDSIYSECDVNYDFSDYLSRKFIKSEEYQNTKYSTYEMLEKWLKNNMKTIKKEYEEFIGKAKDIYVVGNYICIVDDYNYDNPKESIVMIYKNNKDYRNGDYLEQVSLSNDNIRKNIKDYYLKAINLIKVEFIDKISLAEYNRVCEFTGKGKFKCDKKDLILIMKGRKNDLFN